MLAAMGVARMPHRCWLAACLGALAALLAPATAAAVPACSAAAPQSRTLVSGAGVLEGLAVDSRGRLFYTDQSAGTLNRLDAPTAKPKVLTTGINGPGAMDFMPDGSIIVGYGDSASDGLSPMMGGAGLLLVNPETGMQRTLATGLEMANGVVRGPDGAIYASNDFGSGIDRVAPDGTVAHRWTVVNSANGLAIDHSKQYLYTPQTFQTPAISRVQLSNPANVTSYPLGDAGDSSAGLDDMSFDAAGRIYVAANGGGQLWRVNADGSGACAFAGGLLNPSATSFGRGAGPFPASSLYAISFSGSLVEYPGVQPLPAGSTPPAPKPTPAPSLSLPARARCVPRTLALALHFRGAGAITSVLVSVNGRRVLSEHASAITRLILHNLPPGTLRVRVVAKTSDGATLTRKRTYRGCRAPRRRPA
jgi:gluconolactonase